MPSAYNPDLVVDGIVCVQHKCKVIGWVSCCRQALDLECPELVCRKVAGFKASAVKLPSDYPESHTDMPASSALLQ